jgi:hypothetical protein
MRISRASRRRERGVPGELPAEDLLAEGEIGAVGEAH